MAIKSTIIGMLNFNQDALDQDLNKIKSFPIFEEEYDEFATGIWINHSLWNENGDYVDTQYRDVNSIKMTELGAQLPYINELVTQYFDLTHLKMVRTRNLINGLVMPHKDFIELKNNQERYLRILIPLENNQHAFHSDETAVFNMKQGEIWILNAAQMHAAVNFSYDSRILLCLDFQFDQTPNDPLAVFQKNKILSPAPLPTIIKRKPFSGLSYYFRSLESAINKKNFRDIVIELSKLHFYYDVDIKKTYDWLVDIVNKRAERELVEKSKQLRHHMMIERGLGERLSLFND